MFACDQAGLLGYSRFALDGVKLPSNASREWSGRHADLERKRAKLLAKVKEKMDEHRRSDGGIDAEDTRHTDQIVRFEKHARKIESFLSQNEPRKGESGKGIIDNVTDPDSATIKTRHGYIQGYNAQALVDEEWQVVVHAGVEGTDTITACFSSYSKSSVLNLAFGLGLCRSRPSNAGSLRRKRPSGM